MQYFVTGNEYVSLPTIRQTDGGIEGISFLHMGAKGMLELRGGGSPLLRPWVRRDGQDVPLEAFRWSYEAWWLPVFSARAGDATLHGQILAPLGERGFGYRLWLTEAARDHVWELGLEGCWAETYHSINESKPVLVEKQVYRSNWNHCFCMDLRPGLSLFAFAPIMTEDWQEKRYRYTYEKTGETVSYRLGGAWLPEETPVCIWFGLGYEEVSAATSAKEMLRQGFQAEWDRTVAFLLARARRTEDPALDKLLNQNLFFCYFFGSGRTLDTEEYVLVTSRSPRYYVSAAYWDRDSLLWSFPAIVLVDTAAAEEMLRYVFTRQIRNVGIHSRYLDGTLLEPGFELDELCAPVIALARFVEVTGRREYVQTDFVEVGIRRILARLRGKRAGEIALYETFLQPTDDYRTYPYLTYDNVLVWYMLERLADLYDGFWPEQTLLALRREARAVRESILAHCVFEKDGGPMFAWSVDLKGHWDIYDEPPGSLLLLPHYGFCTREDPVWRNTAAAIRRKDYPYSFADCPIGEIGCAHAPHPWILSLANSMLSGREQEAKAHLLLCKMDNGIACESVDEYTGESATGDAFATCAGFLAYAIDHAYGKKA